VAHLINQRFIAEYERIHQHSFLIRSRDHKAIVVNLTDDPIPLGVGFDHAVYPTS
jgi:hypothetical protein